jgi:hypothetical protein
VQTGFGEKATGQGRIEEWSLSALEGFATAGFRVDGGDQAGAGDAAAPGAGPARLVNVVSAVSLTAVSRRLSIAGEGRESFGDPVQREIGNVVKASSRDGAAASALRESRLGRV